MLSKIEESKVGVEISLPFIANIHDPDDSETNPFSSRKIG